MGKNRHKIAYHVSLYVCSFKMARSILVRAQHPVHTTQPTHYTHQVYLHYIRERERERERERRLAWPEIDARASQPQPRYVSRWKGRRSNDGGVLRQASFAFPRHQLFFLRLLEKERKKEKAQGAQTETPCLY